MNIKRITLAAAMAVGAIVGTLHSPSSAFADPVLVQQFLVEVNMCGRSHTEGTLGWEAGPRVRDVVTVEGIVVDGPNPVCAPPDPLITEATFTGFADKVVVDQVRIVVDDKSTKASFTLVGRDVLNRVQITVCRFSLVSQRPTCSSKDFFRPPVPTPL